LVDPPDDGVAGCFCPWKVDEPEIRRTRPQKAVLQTIGVWYCVADHHNSVVLDLIHVCKGAVGNVNLVIDPIFEDEPEAPSRCVGIGAGPVARGVDARASVLTAPG
jgi:hypothetical protein